MTAEERTAADAVYVLRAVARLLRVSPNNSLTPQWADQHSAYLVDVADAVIRDARLDRAGVDDGAKYVGFEWESALIPILFPQEQVGPINDHLRQLPS